MYYISATLHPIIDNTKPSTTYHTNVGVLTLPANNAINAIPPIIEVLETQFLAFGSFFIRAKLARNNPIELITPTPTKIGRKNDPTPPKRTELGVHPDCKPTRSEYATYMYPKEPRKARIKPRAPFPEPLFDDFAIYFTKYS